MMLTLLAGCGYNDIQSLDENVKAAWSETLNQYQRRADLVPQLVSSVNSYMKHEHDVLAEVTEARSKVGSVNVNASELPSDEQMQQFQQAQGSLTAALSRLIAVSENYPELKSDALFKDLNVQLEGTENRIATARGRYIKEVQTFNTFIRRFPTVITAKIFGYKRVPNFGVGQEDQLMKAPKLEFDNTKAN